MAAQVSIQAVDAAGQNIYVVFKVTLSGNYPTGGDPLNFTSGGTLPVTQDAAFVGLVAAVESSGLIQVFVESQNRGFINGGNTVNYSPVVTLGANNLINPQNGVKLVCGVLNTYGTEHSAGAYEAAYTGDIITGYALFTKLL